MSSPIHHKFSPSQLSGFHLVPLLVINTPFEMVGVDIMGMLPKNSSEYQHILVVMDYLAHYPETVPLRTKIATRVVEEFLNIFFTGGTSLEGNH